MSIDRWWWLSRDRQVSPCLSQSVCQWDPVCLKQNMESCWLGLASFSRSFLHLGSFLHSSSEEAVMYCQYLSFHNQQRFFLLLLFSLSLSLLFSGKPQKWVERWLCMEYPFFFDPPTLLPKIFWRQFDRVVLKSESSLTAAVSGKSWGRWSWISSQGHSRRMEQLSLGWCIETQIAAAAASLTVDSQATVYTDWLHKFLSFLPDLQVTCPRAIVNKSQLLYLRWPYSYTSHQLKRVCIGSLSNLVPACGSMYWCSISNLADTHTWLNHTHTHSAAQLDSDGGGWWWQRHQKVEIEFDWLWLMCIDWLDRAATFTRHWCVVTRSKWHTFTATVVDVLTWPGWLSSLSLFVSLSNAVVMTMTL